MLTRRIIGSGVSYLLVAALLLCSCGSSRQATAVQAAPPPSVVAVSPASAQPQGFAVWLADFKREALARGISQGVLDDAFASVNGPLQAVLDRDHAQPEQTTSFDAYLKGVLKPRRLGAAREQWDTHRELLADVQDAYAVPAPILLALWQSESSFGKIQGNFSIIESLATLAYDGRRSAFFRGQLLDALAILQQEHMSAASLTGSWAGAMGQVQFMPSSFLSFAVDFDGDGRKDIWNNDADALASMANYLHSRGWDDSIGWGFHVRLPRNMDASAWVADKEWHTLKAWKKRGLRRSGGGKWPRASYEARLVMPDNDSGNAYLVTKNYDVLMDWNRSIYFATAVGLLADAIEKGQ